MTTTPNEFLQFAKEMGLGRMKSTVSPTSPIGNTNNGYSLTGLSVLNNLCHLIEHIHTLKAENDRLRAHLELVNHVENFLLKNDENKLINQREKKMIHSTTSILGEGIYEDEKSLTISPSNSLKIKNHRSPTLTISSRERQGVDLINNREYSTSMLHINHEQSEMMDSNLGSSTLPTWNNWSKVRHALTFSLRRKQTSPNTPVLTHTERQIPAISISFESDDDHLPESKHLKKKKKKMFITDDNRRGQIGEDTDQDDESTETTRIHHKRKLYGNDTANSSSNERQETSTTNLPCAPLTVDDDNLLTRKQSKIAHYRHKIRSKLDTVKRQFSDQNSLSSSLRVFPNTHGSTFDDIGSGLNHALLTVKLAPAMTKSYQQKMREWETMQKSNFLVNYRRQSVSNKIELNNESRRISIISTINEASVEQTVPSSSSSIDKSTTELETNLSTHGPILSPNQRSLIVHQWREIMSEEISLRHCHEYLERKMLQLKQLEADLKCLKTSIFSTNNQDYFLKHRSMTSIEQLDHDLLDHHRQSDLPQRCRSFQSLVAMPASWILAVQSAAYSDVLDGTSNKTTERAIIFNKSFFNQLKHFKNARRHFEQDTMKDRQGIGNSKTNISHEENLNEKRSIRPHNRVILTRGCLRKLSFILPSETPQHVLSNPMIPFQATIPKLGTYSHVDLLATPTNSEIEPSLPSSSATLNKRSKRTRFDFKKTLQRSKSMCMTQFNSWLQRRRQQHPSVPRRKSAADSKTKSSPCSTPKLFGSPRLARLHQRIRKQPQSSSPSTLPTSEIPSLPSPSHTELSLLSSQFHTELPSSSSLLLDDSDRQFQQREPPVRIYLPARTSPTTRHVRINDVDINNDHSMKTPPMSKITSPIINRRNLPASPKMTTARERRESYAAMSNILNNK